MQKRVLFGHKALPILLLVPQLAITLVFFIWPAGQALFTSLFVEDAFGLSREFVWFENFTELFADARYRASFVRTILFSAATTLLSMGVSLLFATMANRVLRGGLFYKTFLIWPYAVAPAIAGLLWFFLFNPSIGSAAYVLKSLGYDWNHTLSGLSRICTQH